MSHQTNCEGLLPVRAPEPETDHTSGATSAASTPRRWTRRGRAAAILAALTLTIAGGAVARDYHSNPWLLSWIPPACCVTNDCCWEVQESELQPMSEDRWQVRSTGQVLKRTAWSPDGKFYRCACDYDAAERHWNKHQGANTRCLFVPMRSASRAQGSIQIAGVH